MKNRARPRTSPSFTSSRPCSWVQPRAYTDPNLRRQCFGKVLPMEQPSFLQRLFGMGGR